MAISLELTDSERALIETLREDDFKTVMVTREGKKWHVWLHIWLESHDAGWEGHGPSFDRAWNDVTDNRLRDRKPK